MSEEFVNTNSDNNEAINADAGNGKNKKTKKPSWDEMYGKKKKKKSKKAKFIIGIIVIAAIALVGFGVLKYLSFVQKTMDSISSECIVESYDQRDLTTYINTTGTVESSDTQYITTTLQYPVKELKFKLGDKVKKGDVVCTIDTEEIDRRINDLQAQSGDSNRRQYKEVEISNRQLNQTIESSDSAINKAEQEVNKAKQAYEDEKTLFEDAKAAYESANADMEAETDEVQKMSLAENVMTLKANKEAQELKMNEKKASYEAAKTAYDQAVESRKQSVQSAENSNELTLSGVSTYSAVESEIDQYYDMKEKSVIIAESDGIVTAVNATEGLPASGTIMQIDNENDLKIRVEIKESEVFKVKEGMEVEISNSNLEQVTAKGKVDKVYRFVSGTSADTASALTGTVDKTPHYTVIIKVDEFTDLLLGMNVKVKIATGNEMSVMAVPYTAIMTDDDENEYVYVAEEQAKGITMVVRKDVETGETGDYYTEIKGGSLEKGDKVICYPETVTEGGIVKIKE